MEIQRYELASALDIQTIQMPGYANVLSVGIQGNKLYVWAMVEPAIPATAREFVILPTGKKFVDNPVFIDPMASMRARFLGTVVVNANLAAHVFELPALPLPEPQS